MPFYHLAPAWAAFTSSYDKKFLKTRACGKLWPVTVRSLFDRSMQELRST